MTKTPYHPIACGLHETYQLAVMRRAMIDLSWRTEDDCLQKARVLIEDVFTEAQAEYLRVTTQPGNDYVIRLDRIVEARWVETGQPLLG
ncbi:MAG: hypothetical protein KZQ77_13795 [Candidatus Thiodiazotropha sp. (ex Notomyrtea botanica)]|nr:hypothetical protein [Candidatus Thiodiazotropha sp. (ex Notomyrtea botanica)]